MIRQKVSRMRGWSMAAATASLLVGGCATDVTLDQPVDEDFTDASKFVRSNDAVADEYIVMLAAPKDAEARARIDVASVAASMSSAYKATVKQTFPSLQTFVVTASEADALKMSLDPNVELVQQNGRVYASATQSPATWGIDRVDQRDLPLSNSYTYSNEGEGVTAFIIDTGIRRTHNEFGGRAVVGFDAIGDGQNTNDCNGHGTHVAGTVGGSTYGLAKKVRLVAVRVLDCNGSGTDAGVIAGVDWVTNNHSGPSVANMSLGGGASTALDNAVKRSIASGVTYALAAGNENANACNGSPSRVAEAITVGSTTSSDGRSSFSNFGTCVDIFAPGSGITSAWNTSNTATNNISGTSMASPHVCGAAALVLGANPSFTPAQVAAALVNNSTPNKVGNPGSGSPNRLLYTGFIGGGNPDPDPDPDPDPGEGTPRNDTISGTLTLRQFRHYPALDVLPGSTVTVKISDSRGDADLYVRFDAQPTTGAYDCRPYLDGNAAEEVCTLTVPDGASQVFVSVRGYSAATYSGTRAWVEP